MPFWWRKKPHEPTREGEFHGQTVFVGGQPYIWKGKNRGWVQRTEREAALALLEASTHRSPRARMTNLLIGFAAGYLARPAMRHLAGIAHERHLPRLADYLEEATQRLAAATEALAETTATLADRYLRARWGTATAETSTYSEEAGVASYSPSWATEPERR